jgi:hypothetical protein
VVWQGLAFLVLASLGLACLDLYLQWSSMGPYRAAALLTLMALVLEGLGRFLRESVLSSLMLQGEARTSLVCRQLALLLVIGWLVWTSKVTVGMLLFAEVLAGAVGLATAAWLARIRLNGVETMPHGATSDWHGSTMSSQWGPALRMYFAQILSLPLSPQVMLNLVQRYVGLEAAAVFGFLRNLQQMIGRYLPATLLATVIRPRLIATAIGGRNLDSMYWQTNLAGKLNLFTLTPLICIAASAGEPLVFLLTGGSMVETDWLTLGFMLALVPASQRQLLETVAVVLGQQRLCVTAAWVALLSLPLTIGMLHLGLGVLAAVVGLILGQGLFVAVLYSRLHAICGYRSNWLGLPKLALAALPAIAIGFAMSRYVLPPFDTAVGVHRWTWVSIEVVTVTAVFLIIASVARPFSAEERLRINDFVGRQVFFW